MRTKFALLLLNWTVICSQPASAQTLDTLSIYFHLDSDRPIVNTTTAYANYEQPIEGLITVLRLEAHCDTTGSLSYNDALAQRRIEAVRKLLERDRWNVSDVQEKIYSERHANKDQYYTHDIYRRVDVFLKITLPSNAQRLIMQLNAFAEDTASVTAIDLTILFHGGTTRLMTESVPEAKALKDFLLAHPEITADIHGHVCCGDNYPLSYERAKLIAEFLMKQGVNASRLSFQGHSNKMPKIYPEETDADRKQNRRVAIVFKKGE